MQYGEKINFKELAFVQPFMNLEKADFGSIRNNIALFKHLEKIYDNNNDSFIEKENFAFINIMVKNDNNEDIYAYFEKNRVGAESKWKLKSSKTRSEILQICSESKNNSNTPSSALSSGNSDKDDYIPSFEESDERDNLKVSFEEDEVFAGKFREYKEQHSLTNQSESDSYIRFINTLFVEKDNPDSIGENEGTLDDICVHDNLFGLSGFCLKINNKIVPLYENEDYKEKKDTNSQDYINNILLPNEKIVNLDVFIIQSDYKRNFQKDQYDIFKERVKFLLNMGDPYFKCNSEVTNCSNSIKALLHLLENNANYYGSLSSFSVHIIYSAWAKEGKAEIEDELKELTNEIQNNDFRVIVPCKADYEIYGITELKNLAVANDKGWHPVITVGDRFDLMEKGEDYFAFAVKLDATELLKILLEGDTEEEKFQKKKLKKGLFEDNVRDYQGDTKVNVGIRKTIDNDANSFIVLNNGITIIVNSVEWNQRQTQVKLDNPQIVNGCQTCNVIYRAYINDNESINDVSIVAKIIVINPSNLDFADKKSEIVIANNSQNMVHDSTEASRQIHKEIEKWFESAVIFKNELNKVFYERRSKSLVGKNIKSYQKIRLYDLVQSTVAVWFGEPNKYKIHEDKVIADFKNRNIAVFMDTNDTTRIIIYYAAAALFANFERLIMEKVVDLKYRRAKPQICYLLRNKIHKGFIDINESNDLPIKVSKKIIELISNEKDFTNEIKDCIVKFDNAKTLYLSAGHSQFTVYNDDKFSRYLLNQIQGITETSVTRGRVSEFCKIGTVKFVSKRDQNGLPYMFISRPNEKDIYAAQSTSETKFYQCKVGDEVVYKEREDNKSKDGVQAVDVRLIRTDHVINSV